jgi:uncharacterized protein YdeI (YjbR/CyaY-like superfamily)
MAEEMPVLSFARASAWAAWLAKHHKTAAGVWLRIAKKGSDVPSVTKAEALELALCYGWIDGQGRSDDATWWLQKFTPRRKRSIWSKINREKALALIEAGRMQPAGLAEVERAKADGRWDAAYDSPRTIEVPPDLKAALDRNKRASAFFATLDKANRYAVLWRIHTAKKAETRATRITRLVAMLAKGETIH